MLMRFSLKVLLLLTVFGISGCGKSGGGAITPTVPAAPGGVKAAQDTGAVAVSWTPIGSATSYNLYMATVTGVNKSNYGSLTTNIPTNPYVLTGLTNGTTYYFVVTAVNSVGESAESAQVSATPAVAAIDPLYAQQWHLTNTVLVNEDINADSAWAQTCGITPCRGDGVRVAVVDDGLEIGHEDLAFNVIPEQSYNYVTGSTDPTPGDIYSAHGTSVAGTVGARDMNGKGGRGVAPRAGLVGYNLLSGFSLSNELDSMTRNAAVVDVSSNSWGAPDGYGLLFASDTGWRSAIDTGLATGRSGLGTVYVWAGGNGYPYDNSNFDGQANYRGVIAVAALTDSGSASSYSERGANLWVSAPAGNFCSNSYTIVTTDLMGAAGENNAGTNIYYGNIDLADSNYTKCFNGTSAATPIVSGTVALMLQANPTLTWRDVRLILAETTRKNNSGSIWNATTGSGWQDGSAPPAGASILNYRFNHDYGFGAVDANAAVTRAKTWTNVGAELTPCTFNGSTANSVIPANGNVVSNTAVVSGCTIGKIEFIEITFTSNHSYAGDLQIDLVSPTGKTSRLAEDTTCNNGTSGIACYPYSGWVFGSAFHLGEAANGTWTLNVRDMLPASDTGNISSWSLRFFGRAN